MVEIVPLSTKGKMLILEDKKMPFMRHKFAFMGIMDKEPFMMVYVVSLNETPMVF